MLGPSRLDTNSLKITAALEDYAVPLARKSVVGDTLSDLVDELRYDLARAAILIVTGGLGPTEDDMTREALAEAFGLTMEVERVIVERLEQRFAKRGLKMPEVNKKQANVFVGQETLTNERGTAPGFHLQIGEKHVFVFPGVPHELEWMLATYFSPWLAQQRGARARHRRALKIAGMTESAVEERLKPFYDAHRDELLTILATGGQIELHIFADGDEAAAKGLIAERGATVSTAESCTGGLLASRITDVAGSSAYFLGGAVAYTGAAKRDFAGVAPALIAEHGEVSEPVAIALARGIRERFGTTYGVGITGVAGPGGGSEAKPVGTVHIAVASAEAHEHRKLFWPMERTLFKRFATQSVGFAAAVRVASVTRRIAATCCL